MSMRTIARSSSNRNAGQRLRQLGLADTGRAEEQERAGRPVRVADAGAGAAHGVGHRSHRGLLADHPRAELLLHAQQLRRLALEQPPGRDAGPGGDHLGDVVVADLLLDHDVVLLGLSAALAAASSFSSARQLAVLQPRRGLEIAVALGALDLAVDLVDALLELTDPVQAGLLALPPGVERSRAAR